MKLNMVAGLQSNYFFALRDQGSSSDAPQMIQPSVDKYNFLTCEVTPLTYPGSGEILALELDPGMTNEIKDFRDHQRTLPDNHHIEKTHFLFLINSDLNLYKLCIKTRKCKVISKVPLAAYGVLSRALDDHLRKAAFARISVSDRCLTFGGRSFSLENGYEWDFAFNNSRHSK